MIKKSMAAALAVFGLSGLVQAQDAQRGEDLSVTCAACHGADGNSTDAVNPKIAGQNERYLVEQLLAFKNGDRINALMNSMVADLSEEDIRDLAVFYAEQEGNFGEADPDLLALGEQIYRAGNQDSGVMACMACHGPTGAGNAPAGFPRISGQHAAYTIAQLQAYREGYRADEPRDDARQTDGESMKMRANAFRLRDFEIEAVASYLQGLH